MTTSAASVIERVINSKLLTLGLSYIPERGATEEELAILNSSLPRRLSDSHATLLRRWNGLNLDSIRLYGATPTPGELRGLVESQFEELTELDGAIAFGNDPTGFIYCESESGEIVSVDSQTGKVSHQADTLDAFFGQLVFGPRAAEFAGESWLNEIKAAGLLS